MASTLNKTPAVGSDRGTGLCIVALAVLQSGLLLFAHHAIEQGVWPATQNAALISWYTLSLALPGILFLLLTDFRRPGPWILTLALGAVLLPLAWYTGSACTVGDELRCGGLFIPFAISQACSWFLVLHFMQTGLAAGRLHFDYSNLFEYGWQNALTLVITAVFLGIFWLILWLGAALFDVIGFGFFEELITEKRFSYPVSGLVIGFGIVICRRRIQAVQTARQIVLAIFHALLPLLAGISIVFAAGLLITGVHALADSWSAAGLLAWLMLVSVLFINGVYQAGDSAPPYPRAVRGLVELSMLLLPGFATLALWALWQRTAQYGWTLDRLWAQLILAVLSAYAFGYAIALFRRGSTWLPWLRKANVAIALAGILLLWATATPLLDFRRISANSQVQRLTEGKTDLADFDFDYLRYKLGRPGLEALRELRSHPRVASNPAARATVDSLLAAPESQADPGDFIADADLVGLFELADPASPPAMSLLRFIVTSTQSSFCTEPGRPCLLAELPLMTNGDTAWLLTRRRGSGGRIWLFDLCDNGNWCIIGSAFRAPEPPQDSSLDPADFEVLPPQFRRLRIGDQIIRFQPETDDKSGMAGPAPAR